MAKKHLYIFLLIFFSCQDQGGMTEMEEYKVLDDVFIEVVGSTAKMVSSPPPIIQDPEEVFVPDSAFSEEELEILRQEELNPDEAYLDTISTIEVFDTLYLPKLNNDGFPHSQYYRIDTTWIGIENGPKKSISIFLPVGSLKNVGDYQIKRIKELDRESWLAGGTLIVQFSRVFFNEDTTRAFFLVDFYNRFGEIVYVEKRNGKWIVVNREALWIS